MSDSLSEKAVALNTLREKVNDCKICKLSTTRDKVVFGEGNADSDILFIGEGPGRDENITGRPFVGRAGQLLTAIIEKGMNLRRSDVYIANIVKCRPTVNMAGTRDRPPDEDEVASCSPYLLKQIEIISPKVIITLGSPSTRFLLKTKAGITSLRGHWQRYRNIPVMPTYHPSYILRNGDNAQPLKRQVWDDIKSVLKYLEDGELPEEISGGNNNQNTIILTEKKADEQGRLF